ncbi:MAG: hypothetical protein M3360_11160 [Actinomycetota bacterium]|nr:hypothetical protein [Actinomycetota bacterium]
MRGRVAGERLPLGDRQLVGGSGGFSFRGEYVCFVQVDVHAAPDAFLITSTSGPSESATMSAAKPLTTF